jgi:hypothetical protein
LAEGECQETYEHEDECEIPPPAGGGLFKPNLLEQNIFPKSHHLPVAGFRISATRKIWAMTSLKAPPTGALLHP